MGKYDTDDSRQRARKKHRRSRSRSRNREHSSRERSRRSRSSDRRERRRDKYRDNRGERTRRRRSTSKSRRGRYSNSRSRSRSRSLEYRSRSRSHSREPRKKKDDSKLSRSKAATKNSVKDSFDKDSHVTNPAIPKSTTYIPSAEAIARIESNSFTSETFISQRSKKNGEDEVSCQEEHHENAIFGLSGSLSEPSSMKSSVKIPSEISLVETGVMASLLHEQESDKNERWLQKLSSLRQKKLQNNSDD